MRILRPSTLRQRLVGVVLAGTLASVALTGCAGMALGTRTGQGASTHTGVGADSRSSLLIARRELRASGDPSIASVGDDLVSLPGAHEPGCGPDNEPSPLPIQGPRTPGQ
jgi:hypothetical protein